MLWGLTHATREKPCFFTELSEEALIELFNTLPFALVECKKQGGGSSISDKVLLTYLNKYKTFLCEELDILRPNVIVCTSPVIYNYVLTHYFDGELEKVDAAHNSVRYHRRSKTLVFCSFHPSARKSHEVFYEGVMDHFRAFLNHHPSFNHNTK